MPYFSPTALISGLLLALLSATGCNDPTGPDKPPEINEDIVQIGTERYQMGVWTQPDEIYATEPLDRLRLGSNLKAEKDTTLIPSGTPAPIYIEASPSGNKLLFVQTPLRPRPGYWGPLYEIDLQTGEKQLLRDSSHAVSNAVYLPGSGGEKSSTTATVRSRSWTTTALLPATTCSTPRLAKTASFSSTARRPGPKRSLTGSTSAPTAGRCSIPSSTPILAGSSRRRSWPTTCRRAPGTPWT